jgi:hypothetical protein
MHSLDDSGWLLERLGDNHVWKSVAAPTAVYEDCSLRLRDPFNLGLGLHHLGFDGSASNSGRDWLRLGLPDKHQLWIASYNRS